MSAAAAALALVAFAPPAGDAGGAGLDPGAERRLADACEAARAAGKIPGLAAVVVHGPHTVFRRELGVADVDTGRPVGPETAFELASNSKALTALAVLALDERHGVTLGDRVGRFVPWLDLRWRGVRVDPKLEDFVHQTSGLPEGLTVRLPPSAGPRAIEATLRSFGPIELAHAPGEAFEYSSVNYDVLGLVIEAASARPFEAFVAEAVLEPAGLARTRLAARSAAKGDARGHKLAFWAPRRFEPPPFEGNAPAAYFVSTEADVARWLTLQLGAADGAPASLAAAVARSHAPPPGGRYAAGWFVEDDGSLSHEGANPTFSSYVAFDPASGFGVAVLANLNSERTYELGRALLRGAREAGTPPGATPPAVAVGADDQLEQADSVASTLTCLLLASTVLAPALVLRRGVGRAPSRARAATRALAAAIVTALAALLPVLLSGLSWAALWVWAPLTVAIASASAAALALATFAAWLVARLRGGRDVSSASTGPSAAEPPEPRPAGGQ